MAWTHLRSPDSTWLTLQRQGCYSSFLPLLIAKHLNFIPPKIQPSIPLPSVRNPLSCLHKTGLPVFRSGAVTDINVTFFLKRFYVSAYYWSTSLWRVKCCLKLMLDISYDSIRFDLISWKKAILGRCQTDSWEIRSQGCFEKRKRSSSGASWTEEHSHG